MPRVLLTAKNVPTLPPLPGKKVTEWRDTLLPGLVLRITAMGVRTWVVEYHEQRSGRSIGQRFKLARAERLPLAKARAAAREVLAKRCAGEVLIPVDGLTVAGLVRRALDALVLRPATRKEWERLLKVEFLAIGGGRAEHLTRAEVKGWQREIVRRSGYVARHALALLKRAYSWGVAEELLPFSPVAGMVTPFTAEASDRVLSTIEVGALVRALIVLEGPYSDATWLLLLTGVRRAAVLGARREEFLELDGEDGEARWVIPGGLGGRSKSKRVHVVPLSAPAVTVVRRRLEAVATVHLFPRAWQEAGVDVPATWPTRWVNKLKVRVLAELRAALKDETAEMPQWKVHGLRHTLATHMREDLGVSRDVVSAILGHALGGAAVTRVYDRSEMFPERRAALVAWAAWLERVAKLEDSEEAGSTTATVLPFAR